MKKKPHILVVVNGLIPSVVIGIIKPFLELQKKGEITFKVALSRFYRKAHLCKVDMVIFCRNTDPSELRILNDLSECRIPYIYELDDNFFSIPTDTTLGRYYRKPSSIYALKKFITHAQCVRVYNQLIANHCLPLNPNVALIDAYFDFNLLNQVTQVHSDKVRIVYSTSRFQFDSSQRIFLKALYEVAKQYQDKVEVYFWGTAIQHNLLKKLNNVFSLPPLMNYTAFIKKFYAMNFDIGLAPLENDEFHNSKTNNKYREYGACGVVGIYSNVPLYQQCITHQMNGMLVDNVEEKWINALEQLIIDTELRKKIKKAAYQDVKQKYTFSSQILNWQQHIANVMAEKPFFKGYELIHRNMPTKNTLIKMFRAAWTSLKSRFTKERNNKLYSIHFLHSILKNIWIFGKKVWWYKNHVWGVLKINYLRKY